ncbi:hypothetical protein ACSSV4_003735 [Roseovarius sp. MBR-154]
MRPGVTLRSGAAQLAPGTEQKALEPSLRIVLLRTVRQF